MSGSGQSRELRRLATFPRDLGRIEIRWSFEEFAPQDGQPSRYIKGWKWVKGHDGAWHPTRAGVSVRLTELDELVAALQRVQRARDMREQSESARPAQETHPRATAPQSRPAQSVDDDAIDDRELF